MAGDPLTAGNPLLSYDLTTDPFPLQASHAGGAASPATLWVVASNTNTDPDKNPVTLKGLSVTLLVGQDAADLTADASGVGAVPPGGWRFRGSKPVAGGVEYVFTPEAGQAVIGGQGLSFAFNNVTPNTQPGPTTVTVKEGSAGDPTEGLPLMKFPAGWGTVSFWADPPIVEYEGGPVLFWSGPSGATYTIVYYTPKTRQVNVPAAGDPPLSNQGQYPAQGETPLRLEQDTTFYLNVSEEISGARYRSQVQLTVTVEQPAPRIVSFGIEAEPVVHGSPLTFKLNWELANATHFEMTADDGFEGQERELDIPDDVTSYRVSPRQLVTNYTLTAYRYAVAFKAGGAPPRGDTKMSDTDNPTAQATAVILALPVGTITAFGADPGSLPPGWLLCDGSRFDQTAYPDLYRALDNSNVLPDLRGYFLRGLDPTGAVDPDGRTRGLLSVQQDAFGQHQHATFQAPFYTNEPYKDGSGYRSSTGPPYTDFRHNEPSGPTGGPETRPRNKAVHYLIFAGLMSRGRD